MYIANCSLHYIASLTRFSSTSRLSCFKPRLGKYLLWLMQIPPILLFRQHLYKNDLNCDINSKKYYHHHTWHLHSFVVRPHILHNHNICRTQLDLANNDIYPAASQSHIQTDQSYTSYLLQTLQRDWCYEKYKLYLIGHVKLGIMFYSIGNSKWYWYNIQSKSDWLSNIQYCKLIGWYRKLMRGQF